jgi:hypothetical protein
MTMGPQSGKYAVADGISTLRDWGATETHTLAKAVASNTGGGTARRRAVKSWAGNYNTYGGTPPYMPGDIFTFAGYVGPTDGVSGDGPVLTGDVMVDSVAITWNFGTQDILSIASAFSGHLAPSWETDEYSDLTDVDAPELVGTKIQYAVAGSGEFADVPNVLQAVLTINTANQAYVNSSTGAWTGRRKGNADWTLALTIQDELIFTRGGDYVLRLFVDETNYYSLKWGKCGEATQITVNSETGAIIQHTANFGMNAQRLGVSGLGHIVLPGASSPYWGVA